MNNFKSYFEEKYGETLSYSKLVASNLSFLDGLTTELKIEYAQLHELLIKRGMDPKDRAILDIDTTNLRDMDVLSRTARARTISNLVKDSGLVVGQVWDAIPQWVKTVTFNGVNYLKGDLKIPEDIAKYREEKSLVTGFPELSRTLLNQSEEKEVVLFNGKFMELRLIFSPNSVFEVNGNNVSYFALFGLKLPLDHPDFKKMLQSLEAKNVKSKTWVAGQILKSVWAGKTVPSFFLTGGVDDSVALKGGIYKLSSGRYILIPERKVYSNDLHTLQDFFHTGNKAMNQDEFDLPPNRIFFVNKKTKILTCTDENGDLQSITLPGITPVTDIDKKMWLTKPISTLTSRSGGGLNADLTWTMVSGSREIELQIRQLATSNEATLETVIDNESFKDDILTPLYKLGMNRYGSATKVINFITFMGGVSILLSSCGKKKEIYDVVASRRKSFEETSAKNLPAVPCIRDDLVLFPHQAASVAKLNVANDLAILDVGTGGGKTITIIMDIINLMNGGLIFKPMVIVPKNLIDTWVGAISYFTNNQMNIIVLDSKTKRKMKNADLEGIVASAPQNTIFLTSYSFTILNSKKLGKDFEGNELFEFGNGDWIINHVNPDYIALDESHYIKNVKSKTNKACNYIGDNAAVRRIATGTLITNNPLDLVGQLQFLDPCIVGNRQEFFDRYAINGDPKYGWKQNFAEDLRNHLGDYTSYIMYREKDWAPLLPTLKYSYHLVDMTDNQINFYKKLTLDILEEIESDPALAAAWAKMQEADEDFEGISPMLLGKLAQLEQYLTAPPSKEIMAHTGNKEDGVSCKMKKIDELIDLSINNKKEVNNKVIVATHYKESANHLYENSRHKGVAVYYDASKKENLEAFKTDPKIKVIFCVIQSITEGHNLQMANRVIIADVDWTPGKLKQLEARIYRPHVKIKGEEIKNLNAGKVVFVDTVLANDSADCVKFSFQMHKKILNARIMEGCPLQENAKVGFSSEILTARFEDPPIFGNTLMELNEGFNSWLQSEVDKEKQKGDLSFVKPELIPDGGNIDVAKLESMPWIPGAALDIKDGEEPLIEYLENNGYKQGLSLKDFKDVLGNQYVRCEKGIGYITGVSTKKIRVKTSQGSVSLDPRVIIRITDKDNIAQLISEEKRQTLINKMVGKKIRIRTMNAEELKQHRIDIRALFKEYGLKLSKKRNKETGEVKLAICSDTTLLDPTDVFLNITDPESGKQVTGLRHLTVEQWEDVIKKVLEKHEVEQEDEEEVIEMQVHPSSYNDIPSLVVYPDEIEEEELLEDLGFTEMESYWSFKVPNTRVGLEMLEKLNKRFTIPRAIYDECEEFITDLKRGKYPYYYPDEGVRNFIRDNKRASKQGALRIYPLVANDVLYLVVDIRTNKGINLSRYRFTKEEGAYIYLSLSIADLKKKWKQINKEFIVSNKSSAIKLAKKLFDITLI